MQEKLSRNSLTIWKKIYSKYIKEKFGKEHEYKTGFVMWPLRTAVSGKQATPGGATELMSILGKDETLARIEAAIAKLENA